MSQPIQRQADQWSLPDRQASSTYEPSQAELRDLLGGPRIQSGLLNTREASKEAGTSKYAPGGKLDRERWAQEDAERRSMFDQYYNEFKDNSHPSYYRNFDDALDSFHDYMLGYGTNNDIFGDEDTRDAFHDYLQEQFAPKKRTRRRSNTIREAVPRENPAGNLNMSPRKLDQQVTKEVQNKALKPPKPKPIPDDLGQDQSFKVPNQLKAHRDPPLPGREYLASFFRHAEGGWNLDPSKVPPGPSADVLTGGPVTNAPAPQRSVPMPPSGGTNEIVPAGMSMSTYLNNGMAAPAEGGNAAGYPPAAKAPSPQAAPATPVSNTTPASGAPSQSAPASSSGGKGGGGGGDTGGSGWTARDIAPGSIDTSKTYTVQQGDTLAEIAQGAGIKDYNDIAKANNIADPDKINVGQEIKFAPAPGGPSTPVSETPAAASASGDSGNAPTPSAGTPDVGGAASAASAPLPAEVGGTPPTPTEKKSSYDPPLPPKGQLKKFLAGSRRLADTEEERKRGTQYSPENTNPGLNNPAAPAPGGGQPNTPWFTPPTPSSSDAAPGPTPSEKAGEPIKPPTPTAPPSQPTSPNTPASSDATQDSPVKTNDLANASNPNSPKPSEPAGNPAQPASPSGTDKPKTPGSYGPDIGNGFSLSDAMGVIGGIGQGINTAISSIGTIGSGLMGALNGGGLSGLISGFGGLGMLGSTLGITAAAQQQIEASERAVKEQYV